MLQKVVMLFSQGVRHEHVDLLPNKFPSTISKDGTGGIVNGAYDPIPSSHNNSASLSENGPLPFHHTDRPSGTPWFFPTFITQEDYGIRLKETTQAMLVSFGWEVMR